MNPELAQAFLQENPPPDLTDEQVVAIRTAFGLTTMTLEEVA